jgi:DNA-directed RNA polymerase subunit RPC12/RpoP
MSWKSLTFKCQTCNHIYDDIVEREKEFEVQACPECGDVAALKTFSPPNVLRASYLDGTRRFDDHREINKLKKERASSKREDRKAIEQEIRKLKGKIYD